MSIWLQKRLAVWVGAMLVCGALYWSGGARVQASPPGDGENLLGSTIIELRREPRETLTRDEVAKGFVRALNTNYSRNEFWIWISAKSEKLPYPTSDTLFQLVMKQWKRPDSIVKVQSEGDKTATVTVKDVPLLSVEQPLVLIQENGRWGVDLAETYAKWNNLQGVAKAEAIYKLTGEVSDELPRTEARNRLICQSNLKLIALGIAQCAQDYDEKLPPAKSWSDVLQPYVQSEAIFNCPELPKSSHYGYAYNSKLSTTNFSSTSNSAKTVSIYETSILKRNAFGIGENVAFRHLNGANYAFADGHVKWFPKGQTPSFKLKQ
ncbi:MAG TPA: H-X9-DG-CTERM domain-containing protein [Abditibacterium sp.]|jgi:prepilin-type processing-associated H-X9-DG protein